MSEASEGQVSGRATLTPYPSTSSTRLLRPARRPMSSRRLALLVAGAVVVTGLLLVGGGWALSGAGGFALYGCTPRDERLAVTLASRAELQVRPADAQPRGGVSYGCDEDDGFAHAGQFFLPAQAPADVVLFYRKRFSDLGWELQHESADPVPEEGLVISGARLCFAKEIAGVTNHLAVWFPSDYGDATREYGVEITGSIDGNAWC